MPRAISIDRLTGVDPRREFVRGLVQAVVVAAAAGVFWMLSVRVVGVGGNATVTVPGVLLGTALWVALEIGERRRPGH